jgi:hypothetical protein
MYALVLMRSLLAVGPLVDPISSVTSDMLDRQRHLTPLEMGKNTHALEYDHEKSAHSPTTHSPYT